jgi:hypothetical protein
MGSLAMKGDVYGLAENRVNYYTVKTEGDIGNKIAPGVGSIAAGATQFTTDFGKTYASPIIAQYLFDCFPNWFTPKTFLQNNVDINPFTGRPTQISR